MRIIRVIELLLAAPVIGMSNKELATATGYSPPNISRDMLILTEARWVEKGENNRWCIAPHKLPAMLTAYKLAIESQRERLNVFEQRRMTSAQQMMP